MRRSRRLVIAVRSCALLASACSSGKGSSQDEGGGDPAESASSDSGGSGISVGASGADVFSGPSSPATQPGLTTTASASTTAPATRAVIVVEPEPRGAFLASGGGPLRPEDRKAVVDAVTSLGVRAEDISFTGRGVYGVPRVQVALPAASVPTTGQQVIDAVEKTLGRASSKGAVFFATDCAAATSTVQKQAFQRAEAKARQLAENSGLRLGSALAVSPLDAASELAFLPTRSSVDPCDPKSLDDSESVVVKAWTTRPPSTSPPRWP